MRLCANQVTSKQRRRNLSNYVRDFTDKSPGNITEKGQLVCEYPGSKQQWDCYLCNEHLATNKLFESHCKKVHCIEKFIYFRKCGFSSERSKSTGTHMRYFTGTPPLEHQLKFKCEHCKFPNETNNGLKFKCEHCKFSNETNNELQVHLSVTYKSLYKEKLKGREKNYK